MFRNTMANSHAQKAKEKTIYTFRMKTKIA